MAGSCYDATILNNLANLHSAQGEYAAAAPLYERALRIQEKALGAEHPHATTALEEIETRAKASRTKHAEREAQDRQRP